MADRRSAERPVAVPWWAHQGIEYVLGLFLVSQAAHTPADQLVVGALGASLAVLAAVTEGSLGVVDWLTVGLHRALDFVAVALFVVAPIVFHMNSAISVVVVESAAFTLLWLTLHSRSGPSPRRRTRTSSARDTAIAPIAVERHPAYRAGRILRHYQAHAPRTFGRAVGRNRAKHQPPRR